MHRKVPVNAVAQTFSSRPRFSVIVPVLNESRWLPQTLAAIDAQAFPAELTEIVFIDNGSTDGSLEVLGRHPRSRILHEPRRDPYVARNRGIEAASGEYLVFLDADCPPHIDWLAGYDRSINECPADILLGELLHPDDSPLMLKCYETYYNTKLAWLIEHGRSSNFFGHAGNMVISRHVFNDIGLFATIPIVGDTEIIHRLFRHHPNAVVRFVPGARVVHAEVDSVRILLTKLYAIGGYTWRVASGRCPCLWLDGIPSGASHHVFQQPCGPRRCSLPPGMKCETPSRIVLRPATHSSHKLLL